jgi:hypothetical protein
MPRANRHYILGYVWHIPHGGHKKEFLLKFARDCSAGFGGYLKPGNDMVCVYWIMQLLQIISIYLTGISLKMGYP